MYDVRIRTVGLLTISLLLGCGGSTTQETSSSGNGGFAGASGAAGSAGASQAGSGGQAGQSSDGGVIDAAQDVVTDSSSTDVSVEADTGLPDSAPSEASLFDQTMPDAQLPDGATAQGCYDCTTTQCHDEVAECDQDPKCRTLLLCLFTDKCLGGGLDYMCAMNCGTKAGVSDPNDPAVKKAQVAGQCAADKCQTECGG